MGASFPGPLDAEARSLMGPARFMWGSDYPHDEGTPPYTTQHLRQVFHAVPEAEMRKILAENAAKLYGFDLDKLAPLAAQHGPLVSEIATPLDALPDNPNAALVNASLQLSA